MLERRGRSEEEVTGRGSSFILPAEEMKNGGVFVLRAEKVEDGSFSFFGERSPSSFFRPIFDPLFGAEDRRRVGSSSIFGSEDRRLKRGEVFRSSTPKIKDGGIFDLRLRRTKKEGRKVFRRTFPSSKKPLSSSKKPFSSKNVFLSSFFGSDDRRALLSSILRAEDWVEDRRGPRRGDS